MPGQPDVKALGFENDLYQILEEQHDRIDLFVKSKAREIQHRLGRQLRLRELKGARRLTVDGQMTQKSDYDNLRSETHPQTNVYPLADWSATAS